MITGEQLVTRIQGVIIGISLSPHLSDDEKEWLTQLATDQMELELQCIEHNARILSSRP